MKKALWSTALSAAICALAVVTCAAQDALAPNIAVTSQSGMNETGWRSFWKPRFEQKFAQAKAGDFDVVFLGDSITNFWESAGRGVYENHFAARRILNLGFSGDRTEHTLWILRESGILDEVDPKLFVLMIGTNNVGHNSTSPQQTLEGIAAILEVLGQKKPDAVVALFAVFPRGANEQDGMRRKVDEINAGLPALADGKRVIFVSINDQLLEPDGKTLSREMMPDLLHPGAKGYEIWAQAIEPLIQKYVEKP